MAAKFVVLAITLAISGTLVVGGGVLAQTGRPLTATLTGSAEVPGPGDSDGGGAARLRLNPGQREVCWSINVRRITLPATAAHIHVGAAGVAGGVVVGLSAPNARGVANGCTQASRELINAIIRNPSGYYVNVHTSDFPGGAIRGQLSK